MVKIENTNTDFLSVDSGWKISSNYSYCTDATSYIRLDFTGNIDVYFQANSDCGYVNIYFDDAETPTTVNAGGSGSSTLIYSKTFDDNRIHRIRICNSTAQVTAFDYFIVSGEAVPYGSYDRQKLEKYYYNGVLLPKLPIVEGHPYCWIRRNEQTGYYDLLYSTGIWYSSSNLAHDDNNNVEWYRVEIDTADSAKEWTFNSSYSSNSWGNDSDRALIWSSHDILNGSPTATDIYFYGSDSVPESVRPKELTYEVCDCYVGNGNVIYNDEPTISYIVPVVIGSTYTVTMIEVGNRLRVAYSSIDPKTTTTQYNATGILDTPDFSVGYTFDYKATSRGWLVIYVSNEGQTPTISVVTDGLGGDGELEVSVEYGILDVTDFGTVSKVNAEDGWRFIANETFKVCGFRALTPSEDTGTTCNLWDVATATLLATAELVPNSEWVEVYLDSPVTLEANKSYIVSKVCTSIYVRSNATDYVTFNPKLTYDNVAVYNNPPSGTMPSSSDKGYMYPFVDIIIGSGKPIDFDDFEEPEKPKIYTHTIDFANTEWRTLREDVFSVVDGSVPFFVDSSFPYNNNPTLRSGVISHGGVSETTINFTLITNGSVEFNYSVGSENSCDWLRVYLDNSEIVSVSGTVAWTICTKPLTAGNHTLKFRYNKDGSVNRDRDAGNIGYVTLTGVEKDYDRKYLIRSVGSVFTVTDGILTAIENVGDTMSAELFRTYGFDELPEWSVISHLVNPEILYWFDCPIDSPSVPTVKASQIATPPAQWITSNRIDLTHHTITGIEQAVVTCEGDVLFAVSFDNKQTWKVWNGAVWASVTEESSGMTKAEMESAIYNNWEELYSGADSFYIKALLTSADQSITQIYVDFAN